MGFRSAVALSRGTNSPYSLSEIRGWEDRLLLAKNKWLLSHPDSAEAKDGAYIGLTGENLDMEEFL